MKRILVVQVGLLLCVSQFLRALGAASLEDIRAGLKDREAALKTFAVTLHYEVDKETLRGGKQYLTGRESYVFDGDRLRCEVEKALQEGSKQAAILRTTALATFNATEFRTVEAGVSSNWKICRIAADRDQMPWEWDPRNCLTTAYGKPFTWYYSEGKGKITGTVPWEGGFAVALEMPPFEGKSSTRAGRTLIAVDKGFAVVRDASIIRYAPNDPWVEYHVIELHDFKEVRSGLWVPGRAVREWYETAPEDAKKRKLIYRGEIRFSDWNIEPEVSESVFRLTFPNGAVVQDARTGRTFSATPITDQLLADEVAGRQGVLPPRWPVRRIALLVVSWGAVIAALAVCTVYWLRRTSRKK